MIPYGRQDIDEDDVKSVINVLRSDFLTQGPAVENFERLLANYCNARYAVAVCNATSALHISCLALGVGKGDIVWTSPITFVASANCALYCGAKVDFVDIDPDTYNISVNKLAEKLILAERDGCLPKVVIPVHFCGYPCDLSDIYNLAQKYGFKIIEDASHAIGAKYFGEPVGNCRFSDIAVFSFHPVKIITTGEGGVCVTNDEDLARKMQLLRSHGITRDELEMAEPSHGPWYYQQVILGYNYRMSDIHAALGISQMQRLSEFITRRREIARCYDSALIDMPLKTPQQIPGYYSSYHLYPVRLRLKSMVKTKLQVFNALRAMNIFVNLHYIPVYLQPYYKQMGFRPNYCLEAENFYRETLSLPMFSAITEEQQKIVIDALKEVIN